MLPIRCLGIIFFSPFLREDERRLAELTAANRQVQTALTSMVFVQAATSETSEEMTWTPIFIVLKVIKLK